MHNERYEELARSCDQNSKQQVATMGVGKGGQGPHFEFEIDIFLFNF